MRKIIALAFALTMMSTVGLAQIPSFGNLFIGYSYNRGDTGASSTGNLNGWEGSLEGKLLPFVSMVGDVSANYGTLSTTTLGGASISLDARVQSYLFGPRVSFSAGKFRPFAHVLIGAAHLHESTVFGSDSDTGFADAIGGGLDYHLIPRVAWRFQGDALQTRFHGGRQDDTRLSTGLVVRF